MILTLTAKCLHDVDQFSSLRATNDAPKLSWAKRGAPGRTRTCGPLLRRQMLYPLSYGSTSLSAPDVSMPLGLLQKTSVRIQKGYRKNLPVAISSLKNERSKPMPRG